jgi:transposase
MTPRDVIWVGIDVGKASHHAAAVDRDGELLWSMRVANDQAAIEKMIARADATAGEVRWAVDLTSAAAVLLLALLVAAGQRVMYVPGRTVNRMAGAFTGEGKTDAKDARVIADTVRLRRDVAELSTPEELVVELSLLVSHRADLMGEWVRGVNRLRELLTGVFPALERAFDYSTRSALVLVVGYQTPQALREAGPDALAGYLRREGAWPRASPGWWPRRSRRRPRRRSACPVRPPLPGWLPGWPAGCSTSTRRSRTPTSC